VVVSKLSILERLTAATEGFARPVDYSRRAPYRRPPSPYLSLQWLGVFMTSHALGPAYAVTLEVKGRRTGKPRSTVLVLTDYDSQQYFVSLAGESEWVRNVRAARGRAVIRRRRVRRVRLAEVPEEQRPPIIREYLRTAGIRSPQAEESRSRHYFGVSRKASLEEIRAIAARYPVFRVASG
jgi:deazaflavin-dependent oxidoreductase (nitroreductase family)